MLEKVLRFDRKTLRGVHRLFRGVHFYLGGCKWKRGCNLNDRGTLTNLNLQWHSGQISQNMKEVHCQEYSPGYS